MLLAAILRQGRWLLNPSKYPIDANSAGGVESFSSATPQLDMHPLEPGAAVPGAPVVELVTVQNSGNVPHCPQISQHALRGHGFNDAQFVPFAGSTVFGTWGPQAVPATGTGNGGVPELRHIY